MAAKLNNLNTDARGAYLALRASFTLVAVRYKKFGDERLFTLNNIIIAVSYTMEGTQFRFLPCNPPDESHKEYVSVRQTYS